MIPVFNSIKGRLFIWIFLFTSALLVLLGFSVYHKFRETVFHSVDNVLHSKLQILKGLLHEEDNRIEFEFHEIVSGEYSIPRSGHYYKIIMNGRIKVASESLVNDSFDLTSGRLESRDEQMRESIYTSTGPAGEPVRVVRHDFEFMGIPSSIFVAESLTESLSILENIRLFFFIVIPLGILTSGIVGLLIVRQSLKPLQAFSSTIGDITHKSLDKRADTAGRAEELKGLAGSFNAMLDRLQRAFDMKKNLIADASHELKTPLSVITTQCDVYLQKERNRDEYIEALNTIKTTAGEMKKTIDDMLSLARLDSGMLASSGFRTVCVNECLAQAAGLVKTFADNRRIKINTAVAEDIIAAGDKDALTEAFLNMIENAVRYNTEGGRVDISAVKDNGQARIMITDSGPGISKNDLERIFDRFYRADSSRNAEGTGLGLSIAKAIIQAHNGTISVESEAGKGSCFTVTLPCAKRNLASDRPEIL